MMSFYYLFTFLVLSTSLVEAHTWLENIMLIGANGSFVGNPGYPRGYGPRIAGVDPNAQNVYELPSTPPNFLPTDLMCKATQTIGTYTAGYGPLTAAPQDHIALRYLENGHVTQPLTVRGAGNGTVFVYGTKTPANTDTYLGIHRVWNADGTGGDKRGKLIATRSYDDGRCFQVDDSFPLSKARQAAVNWPNGADLPCQTDVQIPTDAGTTGTYTMYWVWEWPLLDAATGAVKTNQSYTSCLDITMTSKSTIGSVAKVAANQQLTGLNAALVGIPDQLSNQFLVNPSAKPALTFGPPFTMSSIPAAASSTTVPKASTQAPATTSAAAQSGFLTITVTENVKEMVTVTVTKDPAAAQTPTSSTAVTITSTQYATISPISATASSSAAYVSPHSGVPTPSPFLTARSLRFRGRR
ncbi:uncharacterized protein PAC_05138 [Phialocephala subalpina]|uniref:DUF7492 domain-containing protein n=1 Tax=Phialocephala subalpina TaxID=576137 RepID=A0A1L7WR55_9HELO|nr:uncharacterized protein PAC_05138 [Phialocephala subalpina]